MRTDALPRLDGKAVAAHIDQLSREPFRDLLKRLLESEPDPEKVKAYGEKYPDKWGALVTMISKLSGYHERLEVESSHSVALRQLSDSELMGRLGDSLERLGIDPQAFKSVVTEKRGVPASKNGNGAKS
jgi:hypothetical protein